MVAAGASSGTPRRYVAWGRGGQAAGYLRSGRGAVRLRVWPGARRSGLGKGRCGLYSLQRPSGADAPVAQWIEHLTTDQKVGGSSPSGRTGRNGTPRGAVRRFGGVRAGHRPGEVAAGGRARPLRCTNRSRGCRPARSQLRQLSAGRPQASAASFAFSQPISWRTTASPAPEEFSDETRTHERKARQLHGAGPSSSCWRRSRCGAAPTTGARTRAADGVDGAPTGQHDRYDRPHQLRALAGRSRPTVPELAERQRTTPCTRSC